MRAVRGWLAVVCCVAALTGCGDDDATGDGDSGVGPDASGRDAQVDRCQGRPLCDAAGVACDGDTLVSCAMDADGCLVETRTDCAASDQVCGGTPVACVDPCSLIPEEDRCETDGARSCEGNVLEVCAADANGCLARTETDCAAAPGGICNPSGGASADMPVCAMPPDPCASIPEAERCETAAASCTGNTLVTCAPNAFGCLVTTSTDCTSVSGGTCDASGAACTAPDACAGVTQCATVGTRCEGPELVTCAPNAFGCRVETRTDCAGTMFGFCDTDATPAAQCSTAAVDPCMGVEECGTESSRSCSDRETLSICAPNAFGCYVGETTDCSAESDVCDASGAMAVCVDPCSLVETCAAPTSCDGEELVTCTANADGCLVETSRETCDAGEVCSALSGAASCADPMCPQAEPVVLDCESGTVMGNTMGGPTSRSEYECQTFSYPGSERIYRFRHSGTGRVQVSVVATRLMDNGDFDLYVLDGADHSTVCTETSLACLGSSTGTDALETVDFVTSAGEIEYIAYDIFSNAAATTEFTLAITCTPIVCGDADLGPGEGCDDGNTTAGDGCSPECNVEPGFNCSGEPSTCVAQSANAQCSGATPVTEPTTLSAQDTSFGGGAPAGATCGDAGGPTLYYDVTVPATTRVTATITPAASMNAVAKTIGACAAPNCAARVDARGTGAVETVILDNAGAAPIHRFLAVNAASGTGTFAIAFTHAAIGCGNGVVESTETCDDGNTTVGDGCSDTCASEPGYVCTGAPSFCRIPGTTCATALAINASRTITGEDLRNGGEVPTAMMCGTGGTTALYYAVTVPARYTGTFRVTPAGSAASWNPVLFRLDACDAASCAATVNATFNGTEVMSLSNPSDAPITTIFGVRSASGTGGTYDVVTILARCGDGVLAATEACDDGNALALDGCSSACVVENDHACAGEPSVCTRAYTREPITTACADMTGATAVANVTSDDSASAMFALPFAFSYFGAPVTHYSVSSNGLVQLWPSSSGDPNTEWRNSTLPTTAAPNGTVAAFWDDLRPRAGAVVRQLVTGAEGARSLVVEWTHWRASGDGAEDLTFQALLFENSNVIEFRYCTMMPAASGDLHSGSSATIGLENLTGTVGSLQSHDTAGAVMSGSGFRFTP